MLPSTSKLSESQKLRLAALDRLSDAAKRGAYVGVPTKDNTDLKHPVSKIGRSCASGLTQDVSKVRIARYNADIIRRQLAKARFVPIPVLVMKDGSGRIPKQYYRKSK